MLCQHIIVCRDSEIAPTDGLIMVGGNSDSRLFQSHQLELDEAIVYFPVKVDADSGSPLT